MDRIEYVEEVEGDMVFEFFGWSHTGLDVTKGFNVNNFHSEPEYSEDEFFLFDMLERTSLA